MAPAPRTTAHGARAANPATRQTFQPTRSGLQGPRVADRGPWVRDYGWQIAVRTYRASYSGPLHPRSPNPTARARRNVSAK